MMLGQQKHHDDDIRTTLVIPLKYYEKMILIFVSRGGCHELRFLLTHAEMATILLF